MALNIRLRLSTFIIDTFVTDVRNDMRISLDGINLIKTFEGLRLEAYKDVIGVWTIGWGHTGSDVRPGLKIDEPTATDLLHLDLRKFEDGINSMVKVALSQHQFDALVSFTYNVGLGNFQKSTMLKLLNASDSAKAALEFPKWRSAGGRVIPVLVERRAKEQFLFQS